ncbi:MAG TPA: hypothetical protein VJM08_00820 [Anaerolineales bacterium]|nr:hypothetical protein [Anaerolineales bacterium]
MGKGAPKAPNPVTTANAQTASNRETAITQSGLNMVNQTDALGNKLNYNQIGSWADGTPRYEATQTLSPSSQSLLTASQGTQQNLADLAKEQSGRLSGLLSAPNDWSAQQSYLNNLTASNLDPSWDRQAQQFETQLINRGIRPGSDAYREQMGDFSMNRSNAYNSANLANFTTAQQSQQALRQAPINEILALSGQNQIAGPQFTSSPQTSVAGTDVAGITANAFNQNMAAHNSNQGVLGGLFSAGASLIPLLSDHRAKTEITKVGELDNGLPVYLYRYVSGGPFMIGLMAHEVAQENPDAVEVDADGLLRVLYAKAAV